MKKFSLFMFLAMIVSFASFALGPISGPTSGCVGSDYYLNDSLYTGGTWTSSNATVASINSSGVVTALTTGTTTITYTLGSSFVTAPFSVGIAPDPIAQTLTSFCPGTTSTCTDASSGGTWSSSDPYVASVNASGVVTGINSGIVEIYYSSTGGCEVSIMDTVNATSVGTIIGPGTICIGATGTIMDSTGGIFGSGGTWSTSNPSIATIDASGTVTGISAGTVTISYTSTGGACSPSVAITTLIVSGTTDPGTIYISGSLSAGSTTTMYGTVGGGTWSSSDPSIATIDPTSGSISGIAVGTVTITYSVMGCGGLGTTTTVVTVTAIDGISGYVNFGSTPFYGTVKVWLIHYNPATMDLEAIDTMSYYCSGTSQYYQFTGISTDSFRIKASVDNDTFYTTTGYIPTYHTSNFYWSDANVVYHTAGTSDINEDINMAYGSTTSGPGFIGGNVTTGANKGTSVGIPAVGMLIFAINSTTGTLIQQTYTDASGNYTFTGLPLGTYKIYPEAINYYTTAYTSITLTSGTPSMNNAGFIQHLLSKTITPIPAGVTAMTFASSSVVTFPNPASNTLNILWDSKSNENATVVITDVAGREVYKNTISMTKGSGNTPVDLSAFTNGLYIVSVRSASINYTNKIQVQH